MEADFSVELTSDDEQLEIPWAAPDGSLRYIDLKGHPELIREIEEAQREPALAEFLHSVNSADSVLQSAKCDAWASNEIHPEEEIFNLPHKLCSYIDLLFCDERRFDFPANEAWVKNIASLLRKAPELPISAELIIRRCHFQVKKTGFYVTLYLFGFGDDEASARTQWEIGLKLVANALRQATS